MRAVRCVPVYRKVRLLVLLLYDTGLRVFNQLDPVVSCGYGVLSLTTAAGAGSAHGGLPVLLRNDALTTANPYTNHLRYCMDSFELIPHDPCARVRYLLPGLVYVPDADATRIAPSPIRKQPVQLPPSLEASPKLSPPPSRPIPGMPRRLTTPSKSTMLDRPQENEQS